jgi:molybdenum cofactor synthesis domain-containing protein
MKAIGTRRIYAFRKPRIGIASTGNELTDAPKPTRKEKIVDISRPILSRMVQESGAVAVDLGIARDNDLEISTMLKKGIRSCDALMVTAGSSVGEKDLVPECISRLGKPGMLVHGVAMRPAMPTGIAVINNKPILSLPGFPISTIFAFRVFGRPMIARLLGTEMLPDPVVKAVLSERITNSPGFTTFVRVRLRRVDHGLVAEPLKVQRSSVTMSIIAANGIITLPEEVHAIEAGQEIEAEVIGEIAS